MLSPNQTADSVTAPHIRSFSASDGYEFAVRVWEPREPRGRVILVHGIISHGGWYGTSCRKLAEAGFEVHFLDRRGSGLNMTDRGDVDHYQTWLSDVTAYLESLSDEIPVVLLGISWGAKLAAMVARDRPNLLDGFGMICPGIYARQQANRAKQFAVRVLRRVGCARFRVNIPLQDPSLFTDSASAQQYIARDPFTLRRITIGFAEADLELNRHARQAPEAINLPTLLMLSDRDRIVDNDRTIAYFDSLNSSAKTLIRYPNWSHTFEFEHAPEKYYADLIDWVAEICDPPRTTTSSVSP